MKFSVATLLAGLLFAGLFTWYAISGSAMAVFLFGLGLLALYIWYFATDVPKRKGMIGGTLTILLAALCVDALWPKKTNTTDERLKYENLSASEVTQLRDALQATLTKSGFVRDSADERKVFPYRNEGSYNAETRAAFKKSYDGGVGRVYVIDGESKTAQGGSTAFVNVFKFWEPDLAEDQDAPVAPMPADMNDVWNGLIAEARPFDKTEPDFPIERGIDLAGGSMFVVRIDQEGEDEAVDKEEREAVIGVLMKRLNEFGGKDLLIAPQGESRILVQMPGIDEEQRDAIKSIITQPSVLNFHLIDPSKQIDAPAVARGEKVVPGYQAVKSKDPRDGNEGYYLLKTQPDMEGKYVSQARAQLGSANRWSIMLDFNSEGRNKFGQLTEAHIGKPLGIKLDDEVLSSPVIQSALYGTTEITGEFTSEEARSLASALKNPLENSLRIESESSVDPALGEAAIRQGILAAVGGLLLTLIFVVLYYRFAGLIALVGLVVTLLFLLGAMAMFQFTLTLPGIAGIILTIGISVDANVLIYERLKEELEEGKSLLAAVNAAYGKAFSAIFDANLTGLITAVILFYATSGPVKGFAVTLIVGIIGSMFSALLVTRIIFNYAIDSGILKKLNFWEFIPQKRFDFLSKQRIAFVVSAILLGAFFVGVAVRREKALGVDFRGGHMFTLKVDDTEVTPDMVSQSLASLGLSETPVVQSQTSVGDGARYITIRMVAKQDEAAAAQQVEEVKDLLKESLNLPEGTPIQSDSVGSAIGEELLIGSVIALGLGLVGVLFYVTLRFEFAFALGAIVAVLHDVLVAMGIVILSGKEMSLVMVGAFLTIAGYSVNDTIVVFDRIRESLRTKRGDVKDIMNLAISSTLRRTILTSATTLLAILTLLVFGGPALRDFAFAIAVGLVVGTYSTIFVAAPIVLWWARRQKKSLRREVLDSEQGLVPTGDQAASSLD